MPSLSSTSRFSNGKPPKMSCLPRLSTRHPCTNPASLKPAMRRACWLVTGCLMLSLPLCGQNQSATVLKEYDQAIDQIAERAMQSVVEIEVTGYGVPESDKDSGGGQSQALVRQRSLGSGVIVDPDGYIITNNHVVAGALRIRVIIAPATVEMVSGNTRLHNPQRVYEAKLIGTNRYADLAVVKIEAHDLPTINLPELFHVRLGQTVIAIGAPQ